MRSSRSTAVATALALVLAAAAWAAGAASASPRTGSEQPPPLQTFSLDNGLKVFVMEDHAFPVVAYSLTYGVGSRSEVQGRSGFAHLFEHMMFQGSENVPKGGYFKQLEANGGIFNGQTHVDYTNYYAELPANKLELALWLEADRMRSLAINAENLKNQQEAVKEEKRLGLDNQPYANALVVDLYEAAFRNPANSHSVIGSFDDLNAATVEDVAAFFKTYYAPNNATLALVGDVDTAEAKALVTKHFSAIPKQPMPAPVDTKEPPSAAEVKRTVKDAHAPVPGVVVAWRGAPRGTKDYYALAILERILYAGDSSRLYQGLVKGKEVAVQLDGAMGFPLGSYTDFRDPGLIALFAVYKPVIDAPGMVSLVQSELDKIRAEGVTAAELDRAKVQFRANTVRRLTGTLERAIHLGVYARFDGDPAMYRTEQPKFQQVTSDDIKQAVARFLTPENRVVIDIQPTPPAGPTPGAEGEKEEGR